MKIVELIINSIDAIVIAFGLAYLGDFFARRKTGNKEKILSTRTIVTIGIMSAISGVLMLAEIPLPFIPFFYKLDFSELPVLLCGFAYGPVAGVLTEALKIFIKLLFKGTSTAYVGELANFIVGCCLILPATILYSFKKTKKRAILGLILGTLTMTICGALINAYFLLPVFAVMWGGEDGMNKIIAMAQGNNANITSVFTIVLYGTIPLNIIKGTLVSLITMLIYKPLRRFLKTGNSNK